MQVAIKATTTDITADGYALNIYRNSNYKNRLASSLSELYTRDAKLA